MKHPIPAIIFAGGKSSRMGRDKTLLPFAGFSSMSEFQYVKLSKLFNSVYISTKENKFDFSANLILDKYKESSPLVGIVSVFESLDDDVIFILSADAPFVDAEIIQKLIDNIDDNDAIIAKTEEGRQPLCGIYKRSVLDIARKNMMEDNHRIGNVLKNVKTKFVFFEKSEAFTNLNHPHEYEDALKVLKRIKI
ncbi:Molybdopterin-guanine dinucleotide biosynthesis protein MobA [hydrothermal vent metagenome]|uniref:Molybdopterin-guanine dinucleotide biosynthesis protein MobA n=1 Tax=hydrothermal vent metagenome TaxID=652676 RepID=A0A1W1EBD7_9ZZZZ